MNIFWVVWWLRKDLSKEVLKEIPREDMRIIHDRKCEVEHLTYHRFLPGR
jgi:hypothetical protein